MTMIEPHPAITAEVIRMASEPASQRTLFTEDIRTDKFERVFSGLQTLLRRNARGRNEAIPR